MRFIRSIDIGKKIFVLVTLCFLLTLVQAGSASTVTVQDAGVTTIGGTANVEIRFDSAPAGISGYNITFSLSNPGIAEITQVTFPPWAVVTQTSTFPSDQVWLKAIDLMNTAPSSNILLATLTIRGDAAGTTDVVPTVNQMDDDSGGIILSATDSGVFTVTVPQQNRAPELNAIGNKNVNEGQLLQFTVSASDLDGDSLTYSTSALPSGAQFDPATGIFTWTPGDTQSGSYPVTFTVSDGLLTDSEQITISVGDVNRAPDLDPIGNKNVNEGQLLQFTISGSDLDGDPLIYSTSTLPTGAQFDPAARIFSWTPTETGSFPVTFTVSDGSQTDFEEITITVSDVQENLAPELSAIGPKNVNEGQLLQFPISATDPNGDTLTCTVLDIPSGATFDHATMTFSWTPAFDQAGSYDVNFTVSDGLLEDFEIVTITVQDMGQNAAPELDPIGDKSVNIGKTLEFIVSAKDSDGNELTYSADPLPDGAMFNAAARTFSWTPAAGQAGSYDVTFMVSDGSLEDSETITVTVADTGVLNADFSMDVTSGLAPLAVRFSDQSSGQVQFRIWSFGDGSYSFEKNPVHVYQRAGTYTVRLRVWDWRKMDMEVKEDCITVNQVPLEAVFNVDVNSGPAPLKVRFMDTSTGNIRSRTWYFGDGDTSHGQNAVHTYREAGTYTVRLVVSDGRRSDTEVKTDYITVTRPNSGNRWNWWNWWNR